MLCVIFFVVIFVDIFVDMVVYSCQAPSKTRFPTRMKPMRAMLNSPVFSLVVRQLKLSASQSDLSIIVNAALHWTASQSDLSIIVNAALHWTASQSDLSIIVN